MYILTSLRNTRSHLLPFENHAWIMSELLNKVREDPESDNNFYLLLQYVTSSCVEKMRRRLVDKVLSRPFFDSLTKANTSNFVFPAELPCKASNSARGRDRSLLLFFHTFIPSQKYPNLWEQAQAAADGKPFEAYTKLTQVEFHAFLCGFLDQFDTSLKALADYSNSKRPGETYEELLDKATVAGFGLSLLAGSAAFEKHMQAIGSKLADHRRDKSNDVEVGATARSDKEEEDEDLLSVQPTDEAPLWQSYVDWLKLMVVHFSASHILSKYVRTLQNVRIAIKVLMPPTPDDIILPWHCLLDSQHFPASGVDVPSNAAIVEFLYSFSIPWDKDDIDDVIESLNGLGADGSPKASDIDNIVQLLQPLGSLKSPVRDRCILEVIAMVECWKKDVNLFNEESVNGIVEKLERANAITQIFKNLNLESFEKGINFTKPFHCELVLGSIISLCRSRTLPAELRAKYKVFFDELDVSHARSPY